MVPVVSDSKSSTPSSSIPPNGTIFRYFPTAPRIELFVYLYVEFEFYIILFVYRNIVI